MKIRELLEIPWVVEGLNLKGKLYWANDATPEFAEMSRPQVVSGTGRDRNPEGRTGWCAEAFRSAMRSLLEAAAERGYDAVIDVRPAVDDKPSNDTQGFTCESGFLYARVKLAGTFAMTAQTVRRMAEAEKASWEQPQRAPATDARFLPLASVLESPEAKALLGSRLSAHVAMDAPAYRLRYGPEVFENYRASVRRYGPDGACKQAVLSVLTEMVEEAAASGYDALIKIRSRHKKQYTPNAAEYECEVRPNGNAYVSLQASYANKK